MKLTEKQIRAKQWMLEGEWTIEQGEPEFFVDEEAVEELSRILSESIIGEIE